MSKLSDYALAILAGGLPLVLDGVNTPGVQGDKKPETTAPVGTRATIDPAKGTKPVYQLDIKTIGISVAALAAVGVVVALIIKAAK